MKDNTRFIEIVLNDIKSRKLILEEDLERTINDMSLDTTTKLIKVKSYLKQIIECNNMIELWIGYVIPTPEINNNNN